MHLLAACTPWFLVIFSSPLSASAAEVKNITAALGSTAVLPCSVGDNETIVAVEWTRAGWDNEYCLVVRDGRPEAENQHPSYAGRVKLENTLVGNNDASMILRNVTAEDSGSYECHVVCQRKQKKKKKKKRSSFETEPVAIINLSVETPNGGVGFGVGSSLAATLLLSVVIVSMIALKRRHPHRRFNVSSPV